MVAVTENAARVLALSIQEARTEEGQTLRLVPSAEGFSLELAQPAPSDEIIEHDGEAVLAVSQEVTSTLGDVTVDVESREDGAHLVLRQGQ